MTLDGRARPGEQVAGVILAGGLSRRMGGGDKGFLELDGKPLISHVAQRLSSQAAPLAINANGDPSRFEAFGLSIIADATADFAGPLAGVLAGMRWATEAAPEARYIVSAACDTPFFPDTLVTRLLEASGGIYPSVILAESGGRVHPVFGLWPIALATDLAAALSDGTRKVLDWTCRRPHFTAVFDPLTLSGKQVDPFFNVNTPQELEEARKILSAERAA